MLVKFEEKAIISIPICKSYVYIPADLAEVFSAYPRIPVDICHTWDRRCRVRSDIGHFGDYKRC